VQQGKLRGQATRTAVIRCFKDFESDPDPNGDYVILENDVLLIIYLLWL